MLGDIRGHTDHAQHFAFAVKEGPSIFLQPNNGAIGTQHPTYKPNVGVGRSHASNGSNEPCTVLGVNLVHKLAARKHLIRAYSKNRGVLLGSHYLVCGNIPAKRVHFADLGSETQPFFALPQCIFCCPSLRDVLHQSNHQRGWTTVQQRNT
jgi:hypothetical protein